MQEQINDACIVLQRPVNNRKSNPLPNARSVNSLSFHCPKSLLLTKLPPARLHCAAFTAPSSTQPHQQCSGTNGSIGYLCPLLQSSSSSSSAVAPPIRPSTDCYLPISYRPLESLLNWEGWGERESEQTMEETEEQTFTFAILSLSLQLRPATARRESG